DQKAAALDARDQSVRRREQESAKAKDAWEQERARQQAELDAWRERQVAELVEAEGRAMAARRLHEIELELHEEADRRSRKVLATTIQRIASDYVAETTVS